ncbi:MAG: HNH endonuclease signature motif containing protein, partial [Chloroflexota bacterium]
MSTTYISASLRREVIQRARNCCEYCLISQDDMLFSFEIDHIIAEKHGGPTISENLC